MGTPVACVAQEVLRQTNCGVQVTHLQALVLLLTGTQDRGQQTLLHGDRQMPTILLNLPRDRRGLYVQLKWLIMPPTSMEYVARYAGIPPGTVETQSTSSAFPLSGGQRPVNVLMTKEGRADALFDVTYASDRIELARKVIAYQHARSNLVDCAIEVLKGTLRLANVGLHMQFRDQFMAAYSNNAEQTRMGLSLDRASAVAGRTAHDVACVHMRQWIQRVLETVRYPLDGGFRAGMTLAPAVVGDFLFDRNRAFMSASAQRFRDTLIRELAIARITMHEAADNELFQRAQLAETAERQWLERKMCNPSHADGDAIGILKASGAMPVYQGQGFSKDETVAPDPYMFERACEFHLHAHGVPPCLMQVHFAHLRNVAPLVQLKSITRSLAVEVRDLAMAIADQERRLERLVPSDAVSIADLEDGEVDALGRGDFVRLGVNRAGGVHPFIDHRALASSVKAINLDAYNAARRHVVASAPPADVPGAVEAFAKLKQLRLAFCRTLGRNCIYIARCYFQWRAHVGGLTGIPVLEDIDALIGEDNWDLFAGVAGLDATVNGALVRHEILSLVWAVVVHFVYDRNHFGEPNGATASASVSATLTACGVSQDENEQTDTGRAAEHLRRQQRRAPAGPRRRLRTIEEHLFGEMDESFDAIRNEEDQRAEAESEPFLGEIPEATGRCARAGWIEADNRRRRHCMGPTAAAEKYESLYSQDSKQGWEADGRKVDVHLYTEVERHLPYISHEKYISEKFTEGSLARPKGLRAVAVYIAMMRPDALHARYMHAETRAYLDADPATRGPSYPQAPLNPVERDRALHEFYEPILDQMERVDAVHGALSETLGALLMDRLFWCTQFERRQWLAEADDKLRRVVEDALLHRKPLVRRAMGQGKVAVMVQEGYGCYVDGVIAGLTPDARLPVHAPVEMTERESEYVRLMIGQIPLSQRASVKLVGGPDAWLEHLAAEERAREEQKAAVIAAEAREEELRLVEAMRIDDTGEDGDGGASGGGSGGGGDGGEERASVAPHPMPPASSVPSGRDAQNAGRRHRRRRRDGDSGSGGGGGAGGEAEADDAMVTDVPGEHDSSNESVRRTRLGNAIASSSQLPSQQVPWYSSLGLELSGQSPHSRRGRDTADDGDATAATTLRDLLANVGESTLPPGGETQHVIDNALNDQ